MRADSDVLHTEPARPVNKRRYDRGGSPLLVHANQLRVIERRAVRALDLVGNEEWGSVEGPGQPEQQASDQKGKPYLDKVIYKNMPEGASRDMAFRAKELDATVVGSTQYPGYKSDPQISKNMVEVAELFTRMIGFNPKFEPFAKKQLRQAINYAIDSRLIIQKLLKEKAFPCVGYLPSTSPAFDPKAKGYEFNLPKAKALMKEAGYEKGFTFECIGTANEAWGVVVVEAIMPFLKQINVTVKPQQLEGAAHADRVRKMDYQAFIWSVASGAGGDPLQALNRWHSKNSATAGNFVAYNNPEFDKLLDDAAKIRDTSKRIDLLRKADAIFKEDAPVWFFNYNKAIIAHQPWVHGIKPVAIEMMYQNMADVWIEESLPWLTILETQLLSITAVCADGFFLPHDHIPHGTGSPMTTGN